MKDIPFKFKYKAFQYINELCDFFNENKNCELVGFSLSKTQDKFVAVYKEYE